MFKRHVLRRVKINDGEKVRSISLAEAVILKNLPGCLAKEPVRDGQHLSDLRKMPAEIVDLADAKQVGRPIAVPERVKTTEEFMAQFGRNRETK